MPALELDNVCFGFGPPSNRYEVFKDATLTVEENEFVAIIGFSGAGKSTLISLLAGLDEPDTGEVRMNGEIIKEPGPDKGIMFQNYSLLPWLSVFANVELAVKQVFPKMSKAERSDYIDHYISMVSLSGSEYKRPQRAFRWDAATIVVGSHAGDETGRAAVGRAPVCIGRVDSSGASRRNHSDLGRGPTDSRDDYQRR